MASAKLLSNVYAPWVTAIHACTEGSSQVGLPPETWLWMLSEV